MPRASYGENFKFFADNNNKATRNGNKYWCSIWRKNQPLSECLNSRNFRKDYFAIDSKLHMEIGKFSKRLIDIKMNNVQQIKVMMRQ